MPTQTHPNSNSNPKHTIIGTPFSTFTRTITLALYYKSLPFAQVPVFPHTPTADAAHPFGYIPTLIIHGTDGDEAGTEGDGGKDSKKRKGDINLREMQAIIRYIDRIAPEPTLHLRPNPEQGEGGMIEERMWEYVSFASLYGFPSIEHNIVKPRLFHLSSGLSPSAITPLLASSPDIHEVNRFLSLTSSLISPTGSTPFLFTSHPTWADLHLFPILADLRATPEWESVVLSHSIGRRLEEWMQTMEALDCAVKTKDGTLSAGADMNDQLNFYTQAFPRVPHWFARARASSSTVTSKNHTVPNTAVQDDLTVKKKREL